VIDSHAHLGADATDVLERAAAAGVTRVVAVATTVAGARDVLALADRHDGVYACLGVHPHEAGEPGDLAELRTLLDHQKVVAVGETGLDYFRDYAPRADQERAFAGQIELARAAGKPLVIHTRAAEDDTIRMLKEHAGGLDVILHCFSMADRWEECAAEGWWFSFAGNVTYPKSLDLAFAAAKVPAERLLVETDAPYLTPQEVRKERNQPAFVELTARFVAQARGISYEELDEQVTANAATLFGW
jgi:TatD DNase family protein